MGIASSAVLVILLVTGATTRLDNSIYDLSMKLPRPPPRSDIVVVAMDPLNSPQGPQWPWPRRADAELIDAIAKDHPRGIASYLLFLFPSKAVDDRALHDAMTRAPTFIPLPRKPYIGPSGKVITKPIAAISSAAAGLGAGEQKPDEDGIVRRAELFPKMGTESAPKMIVQMSRLGMTSAKKDYSSRFKDRVLIPYVGRAGRFTTVDASAVLQHRLPPGMFNNRYVLIGPVSPEILDVYPTPTSAVMSNVEIDANLLNGLLNRRLIVPARLAEVVALSLVFLWLLLIALLRLAPRDNLRFAGAMLVLPLGLAIVLLLFGDVWVPPASFLFTVAMVTPYWGWRRLHAASDYFAEELRGLQSHVGAGLEGGRRDAPEGDVVLQQMTLLQEARRRISDLRRFVSDILANFPEPIFVVDINGKILTTNEAAAELGQRLGVSARPEAPVDALLSRIIPLDHDSGLVWPRIAELAARDAPPTLDGSLTGRGPDGRAFELRLTPTLNADDEPSGWIVHLADITVLVDALEQRELANRQREEALQLLSHDMRSPQASILAVLKHPDFKAVPQALIQQVDLQARRTLDLADAFVRLAQAETADYNLEAIDFSYIAEEAIDAVWSLAQQGGVTLTLERRPGEFLVLADRSALMRALVNLLDNAVKFSAPGASVVCVVRPATLDRREAVACEVIDSAGGMPPHLANKIFNRFTTSGEAPNGSGGIGLGLALVQAVATRHEGSVVCKSSIGVGSVFTLTVPLLKETEEDALRESA